MKYLSLAIIVFLYGCAPKQEQAGTPPPQALPVISINAASVTTSLDYPASIEGKVNVEIRPQVDGYLDKIFVDEGAFVTAGKPLFKINEQPYREQLNSANAALHSAEASVINAQLEIDKLTPLVQNKVVSDIQLKTAKAAYSVAAANVEQAKAQVAAARINLGYTLIKAPVSGYIGRLPKKQGSLVSRTDPQALTNLSDVHEVLAYFSFGENDFISFKQQYPGNTLEEKLKSLPDVLLVLADNTVYQEKGRIDIIDGQFDKNTGAITVRAKFPNTKGLLRSGNTGKIRLSLKHNNALLVPQSATVEMQDKVFVYAVGKDNKVSKQPVTVGGKNGTDYLVTGGVKPGDRIVFSGLDHLHEGEEIHPEKLSNDNLNK
ncbi:membrane fusion protein, multidrug efflux system [Pseudarcicella hirudinis]|uniref:Membrane fusion protein, multidrug efflux system n=1 Tax=Pseudarcicella hirudinis TaxID=1079859 RepID=A0A1I5LXF6_9BACT|nr:efflux RND transporter periplasmic adaptor subunit [Pseudarcicella hirudinis]SFP01955.1 membrane fusion protein, multidrug efflux system [Pseudarcicella hirudinis]